MRVWREEGYNIYILVIRAIKSYYASTQTKEKEYPGLNGKMAWRSGAGAASSSRWSGFGGMGSVGFVMP
jgi:hypothetical protein